MNGGEITGNRNTIGVVVLAGNFAPHIPMFNSALALGQFVSQTNDREAIAPRVFNSSGGLQ